MPSINVALHRNKPVTLQPLEIEVGGVRIAHSQTVELGPPYGSIQAKALAQAMENYARLSANTCRPQLAALVYGLTGQARALDFYFPITRILTPETLLRFDAFRDGIADHPSFELHLITEDLRDVTAFMPDEVRALVAGHLAEIFFYREDLLERFLSAPRYFLIYTSPRAYEQDGGQAGGQFHSDRESIQLVLSRLFEGFNGETPGVAPFIHEFGHMLDFFNAGTGQMQRQSSGFLPGLRPSDGPVYTPEARKQFIIGKQLEHDRYVARYAGYAAPSDPQPLGHPYVFQTDSEFIAGYLEMFYRNPNAFAQVNPALFKAFELLFGWDTRTAWPKDFPFYVTENKRFYNSGERPWPPGISVPRD
jgi:hypothetical protein